MCLWWRRTRVIVAFIPFFTSCYEIPPTVPRGYVGSMVAEGWPPLAVYHTDPFHLRNRWFHRQWSDRALDGAIVAPHADEPFGLLQSPSRVDEAEILAMLKALDSAPLPTGSPGSLRLRVTEAILRADLACEAARVAVEWPAEGKRAEISRLLQSISDKIPLFPEADLRDSSLVPPPLRAGEWREAESSPLPGLAASRVDPRPARRLERSGPGEAVAILRGFAGEAWVLDRDGGSVRRSVYRLDRAEWLQGREPWRLVPEDAEISIRSPLDPSRILRGVSGRLCGSCHCGATETAPGS